MERSFEPEKCRTEKGGRVNLKIVNFKFLLFQFYIFQFQKRSILKMDGMKPHPPAAREFNGRSRKFEHIGRAKQGFQKPAFYSNAPQIDVRAKEKLPLAGKFQRVNFEQRTRFRVVPFIKRLAAKEVVRSLADGQIEPGRQFRRLFSRRK